MLLFGFSFDWANYVSHSPHANLLAAAKADPDCLCVPFPKTAALPADAEAIVTDCEQPDCWPADIPSLCVHTDIHRHTPERLDQARAMLGTHNLVLSPLRFARLPDDLPHLGEQERGNMVVFPHCVPDAEPLAYCGPKRQALAFAIAPAHPRPYPMLAELQSLWLGGVTWRKHPGYDLANMEAAKAAWWPTLAQHRIGLVGLGYGTGGYALAKYVEYMHAGLLLIAERPGLEDCRLLGLESGRNCLLFDWPEERGALLATLHDAKDYWDSYAHIAAAGQRTARERHRASLRLGYLRNVVKFYRDFGQAPNANEQMNLFIHPESLPWPI